LLLAALDTVDLLLAAALAIGVLVWLLALTRRSYPTALSHVAAAADPQQRPTFRSLASNRLIVLIMAFQMLSAVESQWLDFLVNDRAAQRYTDTADVAAFLSRFYAIAFGVDILFLLLIAGFLLRRFGLRYGLTVNPSTVFVLVVSMIVTGLFAGSGATVVFVIIVATRVADMTLTDGGSRASISAAYQAVPKAERTAAQAAVEGVGVPVAIGFSGVALLVVRATVGTDGLALPVMSSVVVLVWGVVGALVYRGYRVSLLANLRHRVLDPAELTIDETSGLELIDRMLESDDERDVRLGLDALDVSGHPEIAARLVRLATGSRIGPRVDALERLMSADPDLAHDAALQGVDAAASEVRAASVRVLGATGGPDDVAVVTASTLDPDDDVAVAASAALSHIGDDDAHRTVSREIALLAIDPEPCRRVLAARVLAVCAPVDGIERGVLGDLLADPDPDVVNAALAAIGPADADLLDQVVLRLRDTRTAGNAVEALARGGDVATALCDDGLDGRLGLHRRGQELLARVCRQQGGTAAAIVLRRHVAHPDREVGLAVMTALAAVHRHGSGDLDPLDVDDEIMTTTLVTEELDRATRVLQLLQTVSASDGLRFALEDELVLIRRRVLADLSLRYGTEGIARVSFQLALTDPHAHGLALEWLDVTLAPSDKPAIVLLDPTLPATARLRALSRVATVSLVDAPDIIDLVEDRDRMWDSPLLIASALLTVSNRPELDFDELITRMPDDHRPVGFRDAHGIIPETISGIQQRRR